MTNSAHSSGTTARTADACVVRPAAQVEIVIPVTSQQRDLALSVLRLHTFLTRQFPFTAHVTIACGPGHAA